jgi:siroheme synthase (precorrin-2 oxidase/ferrochelatase)
VSKFYILEERELFDPNDMSEFVVEFDGDLREFVKEKIEDEKRYQKFLDESVKIARPGYLLTPNELRAVLEKKGLKEEEE